MNAERGRQDHHFLGHYEFNCDFSNIFFLIPTPGHLIMIIMIIWYLKRIEKQKKAAKSVSENKKRAEKWVYSAGIRHHCQKILYWGESIRSKRSRKGYFMVLAILNRLKIALLDRLLWIKELWIPLRVVRIEFIVVFIYLFEGEVCTEVFYKGTPR